ncbi:DUF2971 domain-containing protein [Peijinzhouia sedimentorum]
MRLFKYLSPERIDVLKNQCVRFTQAKYLNDPFEWLPFVNRLMSELASKDFYQNNLKPTIKEILNRKPTINDIPEEYRSRIPKEMLDEVFKCTIGEALQLLPQFHPENLTKILLSRTSEQLNINISELLKKSWNKHFGVLSLTQSHDNIPMWSHYSKNHEGFVIEFDPKNIFFTSTKKDAGLNRYLKEVEYTPERRNINLFESGDTEFDILNRIASEIFFTKSIHWSDEREVRVVDKLSNYSKAINNQEIYLFDFEPKALIAIYYGVNISDSTKSDINSIINTSYPHVKRYSGQLDLKQYKINFHEE